MAVNDVQYDANGRVINRVDTVDTANTVDTVDTTGDAVVPGTNPDAQHDPSEGAALGGLGGAAVGAIAGSATGPVGALIGGVIGAVVGGVVSAGAVAAVDRIDNDGSPGEAGTLTNADTTYFDSTAADNTYVDNTYVDNTAVVDDTNYAVTDPNDPAYVPPRRNLAGDAVYNTESAAANTVDRVESAGNGEPGIQTGGMAADGTPDTRGIMEKAADKVTGDHIDDKTGKVV